MGLTPSQRKGPFKNLQAPSLATGRIMMPLFNRTEGYPFGWQNSFVSAMRRPAPWGISPKPLLTI
jgi:hypothetical protein